VTLADWTQSGYSSNESLSAVDDIIAHGANTLAVLVTAYQTDAQSNEIRTEPGKTPSPASVAAVILKAQTTVAVDMAVSIKLHVDLDNGEWRGKIDPGDPVQWFDSYRTFVMAWALEAENAAAEQFVVGTELAGTLKHEDQWRALLRDVRTVYSGELIYAASWDEAPKVPFWDMVDVAGVNFYAPVAGRDDANRMDILRGWQPWLQRIRLLHKVAKRDILFSEIGYRSVDGAGQHPYDFNRTAPVDMQEQADLYWAALQALSEKPWVRGVYWWNWLANGSAQQEIDDYTPKGKPAAEELMNAWR
jgi:hypothetical protein